MIVKVIIVKCKSYRNIRSRMGKGGKRLVIETGEVRKTIDMKFNSGKIGNVCENI